MALLLFRKQAYLIGIIVCLVLSQGCQSTDLQLSSIDTNSIVLEGVDIVATIVEGQDITLTVPYGTNLQALQPTFRLTNEGEVIPKLGGTFDFSKPVYFTVVHPSGGKQVYTIRVQTDEQPSPIISSFSVTEIEAGQRFQIKGHYFGNYGLAIKVGLMNNKTTTGPLPHLLLDSTTIEISVPDSIPPADYQVTLQVTNKSTQSSQLLKITYPTPQISTVEGRYFLQGDTLQLQGKYLDAANYTYAVQLINGAKTTTGMLQRSTSEKNNLRIVLPAQLAVGKYGIEIENTTIAKKSKALADVIEVFDAQRPFVRGVRKEKKQTGEFEVYFTAIHFEKEPIRFYQVQLANPTTQYILNGLYDAAKQQLQVSLPASLPKGTYTVSFLLSNPAQNYYYRFHINTKLDVN